MSALSLKAYRMFSGAGAPRDGSDRAPPRADLWLHAETPQGGAALARLAQRFLLHRSDLRIAATGTIPAVPGITPCQAPPEGSAVAQGFAVAMRPAAGIWSGPGLRPCLIDAMAGAGVRLALVDADAGPWPTPAPAWLPDPAAATLALFERVYAVDRQAERSLRRTGLSADAIRVTGRLRDGAPPRPCDEDAHATLAARLAGRPVWLAAELRAAEAAQVLQAHRQVSRLAHRLLLIAVPHGDVAAEAVDAAARAQSLRVCRWDAGETLDENTQILLADGPEELPLWYRLAPLAFLGGSLGTGDGGTDPFEAAALGTAVLYGPHIGPNLAAYSALAEAGAARIVRDADSLAGAVSNLIAPDQAAMMAHAGWGVVSAGAALVDTLIGDALEAVDTHRPVP